MNEILWIFTLLISFIFVLLSYKYLGKTGLLLWICTATIISNIQTIKLVNLFGIETSLGTILYGSTFLATDILNLEYGSNIAKKSILVGFIGMITVSLFMSISLIYLPSVNDFSQESLNVIFTSNIRITIASLVAFVISEYIDTIIFEKLQTKYNKLWISNNGSTILCQMIDTIIFTTITYYGLISITSIIEIMLSMYIFKVIIALMDTPFIYISERIKKVNEI